MSLHLDCVLIFNYSVHGLINFFFDTQGLNKVCPPSSLSKLTTILLCFPSDFSPRHLPYWLWDIFTTSPQQAQNPVMKEILFLERSFSIDGMCLPNLMQPTRSTYCSPGRPRASRLHSQSRWHSSGARGFWCHTWWWCILKKTDQSFITKGSGTYVSVDLI